MSRLLHLLEDAFTLGVTLASDAIDSWSTGESRSALLKKLREATERASELALDKARLESEVDGLRFNGPTLYKEEVDLLQDIAETMRFSIRVGSFQDVKEASGNLQTLEHLIDRCDHLPMTSDDFGKMIEETLSGERNSITWEEMFGPDDPGKDVDEDPMPCRCGWDFNYGDTCPHGTKGQGA